MKRLTTEEFKQKYKDSIEYYADRMIQGDLNHIWDSSGEELFEELEEEGFDVSEFTNKRLYDFLPKDEDGSSSLLNVEWMKETKCQ